MTASTDNPQSPSRHSAFAWSCAIAFSTALLAARFDIEAVSVGASGLLIAVAATWIVEKWAGLTPAAENRGVARARAWGWLGVLAFWLWTVPVLVFLFVKVYPDPSSNRAHAELLGVELGPFLVAMVAIGLGVSVVAVVALRALRGPVPGSRPILRAVCFVTPIACMLLAFSPVAFFPDWESAWRSYGADLPAPTLLYLATYAYWGVLSAPALALAVLAWTKRANAVVYAGAIAAGLLLLMLCSALLTSAVAAAWLPVMKFCALV